MVKPQLRSETLLGSLGGVPAGLRQLRRIRPLQTVSVKVAPGLTVVAPTVAETLRAKAYLIVQRCVVRDFLDVVALADAMGESSSVEVLVDIDTWYVDRSAHPDSVRTELALRLADPQPFDPEVIGELAHYKGLASRWHTWSAVVAACQDLGVRLLGDP